MSDNLSEKKYWHELSIEEKKEILGSKISWGEFKNKYKQPDWCRNPSVLDGELGCLSLIWGI